MKLWIWFDHHLGPYYIEDDKFDSIPDAEEFWYADPFFISVEIIGAEPPILAEYRKLHPTYDPSR